MPKVFYTEIDIKNMVERGILSLEINDNVALTDLAYEKARYLGMKLVRDKPENAPEAPAPPGAGPQMPSKPVEAAPGADAPRPAATDLAQRIRSAVAARMGNQIDLALLDTIIQRVLTSTGVK